MEGFLIAHDEPSQASKNCAHCGQTVEVNAGLHLLRAADHALLCRQCGRLLAPRLSALLDLADVAAQVGRIASHHEEQLPLTVLLKMARASAEYCHLCHQGSKEHG